jgi:transposase-like protein
MLKSTRAALFAGALNIAGQPAFAETVTLEQAVAKASEAAPLLRANDAAIAAGQGAVVEPHSFDYQVVAVANGKRHVSELRHMRISHAVLFADQHNHVNGIENFWNQEMRHLRSYNSISEHHFPLFINLFAG